MDLRDEWMREGNGIERTAGKETRMTEIPEDVMKVAEAIAADIPTRVTELNRTFAANVIARAIFAERSRAKSEVDELRYLMSEVEQGDRLVRKQERERCAKAAKEAALCLRGWPVSEEQAERIATAVLEVVDA